MPLEAVCPDASATCYLHLRVCKSTLSRQFVIEELSAIHESGYDLEMVRELLEKRPLPETEEAKSAMNQLDQALDDLDLALEKIGA